MHVWSEQLLLRCFRINRLKLKALRNESRLSTLASGLHEYDVSRVRILYSCGRNHEYGVWRRRGREWPGRGTVVRVAGHTTYTINADGLVQIQDQEWSISPFKALGQTFNPF